MTKLCYLSAEEAKQHSQSQDIIMVDVRHEEDFRHSHIKDAQHLDSHSVEEFVESTNKQKQLIIYCYHGISSRSFANYLLNQGFEKVYSMDGGFAAWCKAGYPINTLQGEHA